MKKTYNDVAILIVTHNHEDYILNLIDSCKRLQEIPKYICDAASSDKTYEILIKETRDFPNFYILKKDILESFSKNNNDLIKNYQLFEHNILLINPDCFFEEDSVRNFIEKSRSIKNLGVSAPEVHFPNGKKQVTWRKYPSIIGFIYRRFSSPKKIPANYYISRTQDGYYFNIEWALGAFLYIPKKLLLLNNYTLLDERYRLYCEDADLCLTAYNYGLKVIGIPQSGIYHALQEKSSSKLSKYNYWNITSGLKFMIKWKLKYLNLLKIIRTTNFQ